MPSLSKMGLTGLSIGHGTRARDQPHEGALKTSNYILALLQCWTGLEDVTLSEISGHEGQTLQGSTYTRHLEDSNTPRQKEGPGGCRAGGKPVSQGDRALLGEDEEVLELDSGGGTTVWDTGCH